MNEHTGNMGFDASSSSGFVSKICLLEIPIWLGMTLFSQMGRRFIAFGLFNGSIFVNNTFFSIHDSPNTIYIQCHSSEPKYNKRLYLIWAEKKGKIDFFFSSKTVTKAHHEKAQKTRFSIITSIFIQAILLGIAEKSAVGTEQIQSSLWNEVEQMSF